MSDTSDAALDSWINWLEDLPLPKDFDEGVTGLQGFITAMRNKVAQLEMAAKSSGKVIVDMAGLPTPSAEFMAAMMPAFEAIAVQEMQKQVDELEAERDAAREAAIANAEFVDLVVKFKNERDAALARESAAYARGVQAALHEFDTGTEWMEIRDAIRALASTPPAPVVGVKPLVWRVQSSDCQISDTPWGACAVQNESHVLSPNRWGWWAVGCDEDDSPSGYEIDILAAKAAAQSDYEARILAALLPQAEGRDA